MNTSAISRTKAYCYTTMESPVGKLKLVASDKGLAAVLWDEDKEGRVQLNIVGENPNHPILVKTRKQLEEYFDGVRTSFDMPLDFKGTDFQKKVWTALLTIPFSETRTYGQIAEQICQPRAYEP